MADLVLAGESRIFSIEFRAGPTHVPEYRNYGKAGAVDQGLGDVTKIEVPSELATNTWDEVKSFQGSPDRVTLPLTFRYTEERSEMLKLAKRRCAFDIQLHFGHCEDPRDFDHGWMKVQVYEDAKLTTYGSTDLGAMQGDEQGPVDEEVEISAREMYEVLRMSYSSVAQSTVSEAIIAIKVCDTISCGDCDNPSDGCSRVFALSAPVSSSPGVQAQVIATEDAYATSVESYIDSLDLGKDPSDGTCVGDNYVAVSNTDDALHYAPKADILDGTADWTKVTTGFVAAGSPNAIWSYSPLDTWIVGDGGYVYFTADPTQGVVVQNAGVATTENLADVAGWNSKVVVAVGANNAVIYTLDGSTWSAVTGPAVGIALNCVDLRSENEWWVGTADGNTWYTTNQGYTWVEKILPSATNIAQVDDIKWASDTVGYIAVRTAAPAGKILRTISGGNTWYYVPESPSLSVPANDYINALAVCPGEVNVLFAGGLADNAADGIIIKGSD